MAKYKIRIPEKDFEKKTITLEAIEKATGESCKVTIQFTPKGKDTFDYKPIKHEGVCGKVLENLDKIIREGVKKGILKNILKQMA